MMMICLIYHRFEKLINKTTSILNLYTSVYKKCSFQRTEGPLRGCEIVSNTQKMSFQLFYSAKSTNLSSVLLFFLNLQCVWRANLTFNSIIFKTLLQCQVPDSYIGFFKTHAGLALFHLTSMSAQSGRDLCFFYNRATCLKVCLWLIIHMSCRHWCCMGEKLGQYQGPMTDRGPQKLVINK